MNTSNTSLSLSGIISTAWTVYKSQLRSITFVSLLIYTPLYIALSYTNLNNLTGNLDAYLNMYRILEFFFGVIATMAIAFITKKALAGETPDAQDALQESLSSWPAVIKTNLLAGILLLGLFILLIVPGVIFYVYWMFTSYIVILEKKSGNAALQYSKKLVEGNWTTVAWNGLVLGVLGLFLGGAISLLYLVVPESRIVTITIDVITEIPFAFFTVAYAVFFLRLQERHNTKDIIDNTAQ